jgi:predicted secreted protein
MGVVTGLAVYFVIWWLSLFMVLPWGAHRPDAVEPGTTESAPDKPRIWTKFAAATLLAAVFWIIIFGVIELELIDVRSL